MCVLCKYVIVMTYSTIAEGCRTLCEFVSP